MCIYMTEKFQCYNMVYDWTASILHEIVRDFIGADQNIQCVSVKSDT